jgi:hypothetical protein
MLVVAIAQVSVLTILVRGVEAAAAPTDDTGAVQTLEIQATDFSFDAPATIPAGRTRVVLHNNGTAEPHQATLVRLNDGVTTGDYLAALAQSFEARAAKGTSVGGPNGAGPGHESGVVVDLEEGLYAVLRLIPSPDGQPHVVKGMSRDLTVTAPSARSKKAKKLPTLALSEYQFKVPKQLTTPAFQPAPGPQPEDIGGTAPISPGERVWLDTKLPIGKYLLLCFIPDPNGTAHLKLGMIHPLTV